MRTSLEMQTSLEISVDTAEASVVSTGVSGQMQAVNMGVCAGSVLDEPKLAEDGSDTQIQSKLAATSVAATAEVPAVGATVCGESAPVALNITLPKARQKQLTCIAALVLTPLVWVCSYPGNW